MKVAFVFLFSLTFYQIALAQKTVKMKVANEVFYVLQSDETVKHGQYTLKSFGLQVEGQYENGEKVGEWSYLVDKELMHKYDWSKRLLVYNGNNQTNGVEYESPFLLGGMQMFYTLAGTQLRYPSEARRMGVEGKVYFEITVTKEGKMINPTIVSGIGYGCDEETLRVLKNLDLDWLPGKDESGNPVDVKMKMPMYFKLAN